jgi:D-lactate dehydrogenase
MEKITDELLRFCLGTDASFYRKTPKQVIRTDSEADVAAVLKECSATKTPVTFRAAGTSLSGQSVSDSVLLVAGKGWEKYSVGKEGETVTLQPGIVGAKVNRILKPYGRKFGPDPASIGSCMVGGIIANIASGMSCGVHANADKTLLSARLILADGTLLDTGDPASREAFRNSHPAFLEKLEALRDEVRRDGESSPSASATNIPSKTSPDSTSCRSWSMTTSSI